MELDCTVLPFNRHSIFRPFAPAILLEDLKEWFDLESESPYMLLVSNVVKARLVANENSQENTNDSILDFTSKRNFGDVQEHPIVRVPNAQSRSQEIMMKSGKKGTKRSVSETKKKFVASRQQWCCKHCQDQLNAWFEVDHKVRLEHGGSNHVDNLEALCRECHGKKTAMENL